MLQLMKAAKSFSSVWQDGKPELAKDVLSEDVVSKDLLFGNETKGFDNWSKMVHSIFEVSCCAIPQDLHFTLLHVPLTSKLGSSFVACASSICLCYYCSLATLQLVGHV